MGAQYSQTLRGALLCIGENGGDCTTELDIYKCVDDVYAKVIKKCAAAAAKYVVQISGVLMAHVAR